MASSSHHDSDGIVFMTDMENNTFVQLSLRRRAIVREFKNKMYVDIREYYKDKSGDSKPGRKGISIPPDCFEVLCRAGDQIKNALKDRNTAFQLELDEKKMVTISDFRNNFSVDIREYYIKDGNQSPTRKGINLEGHELELLLRHGYKILALAKGEDPDTFDPDAKNVQNEDENIKEEEEEEIAGKDEQKQQEDVKDVKKEKKKSKKRKRDEEEEEEEKNNGAVQTEVKQQKLDTDGNWFVDLSTRRRVTVKEFKKKVYVDVREYYRDKDGSFKPGKKGVSLTPANFEIVCEAGVQILNALQDRNTAFELELDEKKFVTISDFRNNFSIDIREYYTKDGNRSPTRKGSNLDRTEMETLLKQGEEIMKVAKELQGE